jgi:hypothetical protein
VIGRHGNYYLDFEALQGKDQDARQGRTATCALPAVQQPTQPFDDDDGEIESLIQHLDDGWRPPDLRLRIRIACRRSPTT